MPLAWRACSEWGPAWRAQPHLASPAWRAHQPHRVTASGRHSAPQGAGQSALFPHTFLHFWAAPQCTGSCARCRMPCLLLSCASSLSCATVPSCAACSLMTSCVPRPEACSPGAGQPHFHTRRHNECLHKGYWVPHWALEQSQPSPRRPIDCHPTTTLLLNRAPNISSPVSFTVGAHGK